VGLNEMNMFHKSMSKLGRYRLIPDRQSNEDYMHRYYLFLKDRVSFPFNLLLHKIVRSDDPVYHDHPWPYTTIVLWGGYWEHTPEINGEGIIIAHHKTWRGPGSVISRKAHEYHWLELDNNKPAITLFIPKKRISKWGFFVDDGTGKGTWVPHESYLVNDHD
jgi:hypothetical protein